MGIWIEGINDTYIALVPEIKAPTKVLDFRSISLCNVLYKIIANVLVNILNQCI